MKIAFIDHYDSFSFNLIDWVSSAGASVEVLYIPFDDQAKMSALRRNPLPLLLSPGPKAPQDAASTVALVQNLWGIIPMLGVCLGHQILAHARGGNIVHHPDPHHGMRRPVQLLREHPIFAGCPPSMTVGMYNSLTVDPERTSATGFDILAIDAFDQVQAIAARDPSLPPTVGLQFHPESFMSADGPLIARNWLHLIAT